MKRLTLIVFLFSLLKFPVEMKAQIDSAYGLFAIDTCEFDTTCLTDFRFDTMGIWQIGTSHKSFFDSSYGLFTDSISAYDTSLFTYVEFTPAIQPLQSYGNLLISFEHKYETDLNKDGGYMEISYNDGDNWINVMDNDKLELTGAFFNNKNFYTLNDTIRDSVYAFTGTQSDFITSVVQFVWFLPLKSAYSDTIKFRFVFESDNNQTNKAGWILKNLNFSFVDFGSGIEELNDHYINASPNPTNSMIYFDNAGSKEKKYFILNSSGLIIQQGEMKDHRIDLSRYPSGEYIIVIQDDSETKFSRVLKID